MISVVHMIGEQSAAEASVMAGVQQVVQFGPTLGDVQFGAIFRSVLSIAGGAPEALAGEVDAESKAGETIYRFYWIREDGFGAVLAVQPDSQSSFPEITGWVRPLSSLTVAHVDVVITGGRVIREEMYLHRKVRICWSDDRAEDVVLDASRSTNEANRGRLETLIDAVLDRAHQ